jgi:hypothetical protein
MLYLRNTNQVQTIERQQRGMAPERPWGIVSASYNATQRTTGSLSILNDGNVISTLTASGSKFNSKISASNDVTVLLTGSVTSTTLTGSFTMSLSVSSSDYNYDTTVYNFGQLTAFFQPQSASLYEISGSLTYGPDGNFTTCSYYFVKSGDVDAPTTASYRVCNTTSSVEMYFTSSYVTASLGCVRDNTVQWIPSGSLTQYAQVWASPYGCDFKYPTGSIANRRVRFETPTYPYPGQNWYLASWVPDGTDTYQFQILHPGETLTVCTEDFDSAFFSVGENDKFGRQYIVDLGVC